MEAKCSLSTIVGDSCTYERRDKAKKTEVIPSLYCTQEIAGHKSTWGISDVETEVYLILARAAVFTFPENIGQFTICPYNLSSLGTGWRRGSQRCQVPEKLSGHSEDRRWPKAERGLGKREVKLIHQWTGVFVAVGSGVCRICRILLSKLDCEAESSTESGKAPAEKLSDETEVLVPIENLTIRPQLSFTSTWAGGLPSVNVTVSGPPEPETFPAIMLEGVSAVSNIEYTDEGLIVWRAYKIGPGKLIQWEKLDVQPNTEVPVLSAVDSVTNGQKANFTTIQSKKPKISSKQADTPAPSDSPSSDESSSDESTVSLFSCPEEGCIKRYQRFSSLQRYLDCGKHHRAIENP
ncbi:hypothetical protein ACROYT_G004292 [Oculina patagonica]